MWTPSLDAALQHAVIQTIFDFDAVALKLSSSFLPHVLTSNDCRMRYAELDLHQQQPSSLSSNYNKREAMASAKETANMSRIHGAGMLGRGEDFGAATQALTACTRRGSKRPATQPRLATPPMLPPQPSADSLFPTVEEIDRDLAEADKELTALLDREIGQRVTDGAIPLPAKDMVVACINDDKVNPKHMQNSVQSTEGERACLDSSRSEVFNQSDSRFGPRGEAELMRARAEIFDRVLESLGGAPEQEVSLPPTIVSAWNRRHKDHKTIDHSPATNSNDCGEDYRSLPRHTSQRPRPAHSITSGESPSSILPAQSQPSTTKQAGANALPVVLQQALSVNQSPSLSSAKHDTTSSSKSLPVLDVSGIDDKMLDEMIAQFQMADVIQKAMLAQNHGHCENSEPVFGDVSNDHEDTERYTTPEKDSLRWVLSYLDAEKRAPKGSSPAGALEAPTTRQDLVDLFGEFDGIEQLVPPHPSQTQTAARPLPNKETKDGLDNAFLNSPSLSSAMPETSSTNVPQPKVSELDPSGRDVRKDSTRSSREHERSFENSAQNNYYSLDEDPEDDKENEESESEDEEDWRRTRSQMKSGLGFDQSTTSREKAFAEN